MYNRRRAFIEQYKEQLRERVFYYLYHEDKTFIEESFNAQQMIAIEELLSDFADVIDEGESRTRIQLYAETHFTDAYKKALHHRRWSIRMNTLYAIEDFHMEGMLASVLSFYDKPSLTVGEESQFLKILVVFQHPQFLYYITHSRQPLSESVYRSLYGQMNDEQFRECVKVYDELPIYLQLSLIDMIGIEHKWEYASFLKEQLSSSVDEQRIRALKALNELSYPMEVETLLFHVHASGWQERMMATKLLGKTKDEQALPLLETLLQDVHFSVRSNAAKSMLLIRNGKDYLFQVYQNTEDRYAKDMAREWLERGGVELVE